MFATALAVQGFSVWVSYFPLAFDTQDNTQFLGGCKRAKSVFGEQNCLIKAKPAKGHLSLAGFMLPSFGVPKGI
jgi:hypothetical protein